MAELEVRQHPQLFSASMLRFCASSAAGSAVRRAAVQEQLDR
ncbi:hypothetical protein [Novosphingobium sp. Gsoil 351]|nr:hypothetical protein [Novosphingobium sp. Gsoil 351]